MKISIIIPTLNEAQNIGSLVRHLKNSADKNLLEIIVVDAQSTDNTEGVASAAGAKVVQSPKRSRAAQMNFGAKNATGEVLYFVHADCFPPTTFIHDIEQAILDGFPLGCYRYRFDSRLFLLKINAFFTRFPPLWCRGGDETLFVTKAVFAELGGYDEHFVIMEEYDFIKRARAKFTLKLMPNYALVSARKYETNGYFRVQLANLRAFRMYKKGVHPQKIADTYKQLLSA